MKITIIVPTFNEERTINTILKKIDDIDLGVKKEIIIVDDGSTDKTLSVISDFQFQNSKAEIIRHRKNKGKGAAIQSAIKSSTGDIIVIQDADLEYDPNDIPRLIKPIIEKKAKVVYGSRLRIKPILFGKNRTPFLTHFFGNKLLSFITSMLYGYSISDMETGHKAFNSDVLKGIKLRAKSFDFEPEITAKILKRKIRIHEIPIKTKPRNYHQGKKLLAIKDGPIALTTLIKYKFVD